MSNVHPFSQPGFWEFVSSMKGRKNDEAQETSYNGPAAERPRGSRGGRRGHGRWARNAGPEETPAPLLADLDPMPVESGDNEKAMPPQYAALPHTAEVVASTSEDGKAADAMPQNGGDVKSPGRRGRGKGMGPRGEGCRGRPMRKMILKDGYVPSEEELSKFNERRRLRREAKGKPDDGLEAPFVRRYRRRLAEANDPSLVKGSNLEGETPMRARGPYGLRRSQRNTEAPGPHDLQSGTTRLADGSSPEAGAGTQDATFGRRGRRDRHGGPRGGRACGMKQAPLVHLDDITQGGPKKFAPYFAQGANPSNDESAPAHGGHRGRGFGPRARRMPASNDEESPNCGHSNDNGNESVFAPGGQATQQQQKETGPVTQPRGTTPAAETNLNDGPAPRGRGRNFRMQNKNWNGPNKANRTFDGPGRRRDLSFKPRADVFSTSGAYIVHLPVPGATENDVGVMWDTEKCVLRIAGVIQRPDPQHFGTDATLIRGQRPVGSFNRVVRFGKKNEKVKVYEHGITAKLENGVLEIEIPKYDGDEMTSDGEFVDLKPAQSA